MWLDLPAGAVAAVLNVVFLPTAEVDENGDPLPTKRGWVSVGGLPPTPENPGTTLNWTAGATVAQSQMTVLVTEGKKIHLGGNRTGESVIDVTGLYW